MTFRKYETSGFTIYPFFYPCYNALHDIPHFSVSQKAYTFCDIMSRHFFPGFRFLGESWLCTQRANLRANLRGQRPLFQKHPHCLWQFQPTPPPPSLVIVTNATLFAKLFVIVMSEIFLSTFSILQHLPLPLIHLKNVPPAFWELWRFWPGFLWMVRWRRFFWQLK